MVFFFWRDTCVTSTQLNRSFWNKMSLSPPWKVRFSGSILFKNELNFNKATMGYMLLRLTQMGLFQETHVFIQLTWIDLSGANWAYLHLENYDLPEVFFQTLTLFSQGNKVLDSPALTRMVSFERYMCFFNLAEQDYLDQTDPFCTLKYRSCRKY
jgi:hypothetical protein